MFRWQMFIWSMCPGPGWGWTSMQIARRHLIRRIFIHKEDMVSCLFFPHLLVEPFRHVKVPIDALYWVISTPIVI
jgi:hypothetical protein